MTSLVKWCGQCFISCHGHCSGTGHVPLATVTHLWGLSHTVKHVVWPSHKMCDYCGSCHGNCHNSHTILVNMPLHGVSSSASSDACLDAICFSWLCKPMQRSHPVAFECVSRDVPLIAKPTYVGTTVYVSYESIHSQLYPTEQIDTTCPDSPSQLSIKKRNRAKRSGNLENTRLLTTKDWSAKQANFWKLNPKDPNMFWKAVKLLNKKSKSDSCSANSLSWWSYCNDGSPKSKLSKLFLSLMFQHFTSANCIIKWDAPYSLNKIHLYRSV